MTKATRIGWRTAFKQEALRLVDSGQSIAAAARGDAFSCQSALAGSAEGVAASSGLIKLGSAPAMRRSASLVVSSMRVLLLWSRRTALNASWHNTKRFFVCSASKTISERIADTFRGTWRVAVGCNILAKNSGIRSQSQYPSRAWRSVPQFHRVTGWRRLLQKARWGAVHNQNSRVL
jgi:hypothetical protein